MIVLDAIFAPLKSIIDDIVTCGMAFGAYDWRQRGHGFDPGRSASELTLAIPFTPLCRRLSGETLKAVGLLYLVAMPGEVCVSGAKS